MSVAFGATQLRRRLRAWLSKGRTSDIRPASVADRECQRPTCSARASPKVHRRRSVTASLIVSVRRAGTDRAVTCGRLAAARLSARVALHPTFPRKT
jgi:hypothetical protein